MSFSIDEIRGKLIKGGARQNLFKVSFVDKGDGLSTDKIPFMCQAAAIPSSDLGTIAVPYFGRTIKLAGDREFGPWTVQILNDEDFKIRNSLETWSNKLNGLETNLRFYSNVANYKSNAYVYQYDKQGKVIRQYKFVGIYPSNISEIGLNWAENNAIETFSVTFQYDYWHVVGGQTGDGGGEGFGPSPNTP